MTDVSPPNTPVNRLSGGPITGDQSAKGGDQDLPAEDYPKPPNLEEMGEEEIGAWYYERLSPVEQAKFDRIASEVLSDESTTEAHYRVVMNEFHADLTTPVNLRKLEAKLRRMD